MMMKYKRISWWVMMMGDDVLKMHTVMGNDDDVKMLSVRLQKRKHKL